jgi:hypothetical protein
MQLFKNFYFMLPEGSLPCSQEPSAAPYPVPDQSSSYQSILRYIFILYIHLRLDDRSGLFPFGFPTHNPYVFLLSPFALHALPISCSLN